MKLNNDCIRDVLLYLETNLKIDNRAFLPITATTLQENLLEYTKEDVYYSIYNLNEIGFIECSFGNLSGDNHRTCDVYNITYAGHQFLNAVRKDTTWEKAKTIAAKVGNHTLKFIESIALNIATECAKQAVIMAFANQ